MRREPVDSSRTNLSRNVAEVEQLDEPVDALGATRRSGLAHVAAGAARPAVDAAHLEVALEGDGDVLVDGERREQAGVLERAVQARAWPAGRGRGR